jgi:glycosyltransferase involved in cell wall biosynthesis
MYMSHYPLVSIVVATYNGEQYIEEQLNALLKQTYPNLEIIISDDCSKDNTVPLLERYAQQYTNIRIVKNTTNLGYISNFENGCKYASGEYLSLCDQDDVWEPEKTTVLMNAIGDAPLIYSDSLMVTEALEPIRRHSDLKQLATFDNPLYFATDNCVAGHAMIIRKDVVFSAMPFPLEMPHDLWLAFNATLQGPVKYYDEAFVLWRQHSNNITGLKKSRKAEEEKTRKRLLIFRDTCTTKEKEIFNQLARSYENYSFSNNLLRMRLYFKYQRYLIAMKKRTALSKFLFCTKMFFRMRLGV